MAQSLKIHEIRVLRIRVECSTALWSVKIFLRTRLAAHEYPREVEFLDALPMTTTGKIIRRALRERARSEPPAAG